MSNVYPFTFHICGGCNQRVSQTNECPSPGVCPNDPARSLICTGCGETYPANQIEGSLHDHWTAADPKDGENDG